MLNTIVNAKKIWMQKFFAWLKRQQVLNVDLTRWMWITTHIVTQHIVWFDQYSKESTQYTHLGPYRKKVPNRPNHKKNFWLSKYFELKSSFNLLYKRIQKKNNNTTKSVMVLLDTSLSKLCLGQQRSSSFLDDLCCFRNQNDVGRQSF
jgi:hypothetical protein